MRLLHFTVKGFSLIELLVVISIIGILSSVVYMNFGTAGATGRDAKRQADLKILQNAIEQYKTKYGRYPEQGCGIPASTFATEATCLNNYIVGLVPEFLPRLPHDPRRGTFEGYSYLTNSDGTVYKIIAMNTVESETVTDAHPMKSCDIIFASASNDIRVAGWCSRVQFAGSSVPAQCQNTPSGRFQKSIALWGGFLPLRKVGGNNQLVGDATDAIRVQDTTEVICR